MTSYTDSIRQQKEKEDKFCSLCYFFRNPSCGRSPCGLDRTRYVERNRCGWGVIDGVSISEMTSDHVKFYDENDCKVCYQRQGENALANLMAAINRKKSSMDQTYNRDGSSDGFGRK